MYFLLLHLVYIKDESNVHSLSLMLLVLELAVKEN